MRRFQRVLEIILMSFREFSAGFGGDTCGFRSFCHYRGVLGDSGRFLGLLENTSEFLERYRGSIGVFGIFGRFHEGFKV